MARDEIVCETICALIFPSNKEALLYMSCIVYDNHYRVSIDNVAEGFTTFNYTIALMRTQPCHTYQGDMNVAEGGCHMLEFYEKIHRSGIHNTP